MQRISDMYYSAERSFADKSKTLCLQSFTRFVNLDISFPFVKIGYLEKSEKESILSTNSASHTSGRNHHFWIHNLF